MKLKDLIIFAFFLVCHTSLAQTGTYSGGGDGSSEVNAIHIASTDDLIELSNTEADWGLYFIQTADIEFNNDETQVDWDGDGLLEWGAGGDDVSGFSKIGNSVLNFTGVFDGNGFAISNLYIIGGGSNVGLFGYLTNATITNVHLLNYYCLGSNLNVGSIAGYASSSDISDCFVNGKIENSGNNTGGLLGISWEATISNCQFAGTIQSTGDNVGGIAGNGNGNTTSYLNNCCVTGYVASTGSYVGGIVGTNARFQIENCYTSGAVSGNERVGGLVGNNDNISIINSFASGSVTGNSMINGLTGWVYGASNITNCYFDNQTTSQTTNTGGAAFTTEQFKNTGNFDAGWNIDYASGANNSNPWLSNSNGRPYLYYQKAALSGSIISNNNVQFNVLENTGTTINQTGIRYSPVSPISWTSKLVGTTSGNDASTLFGLDYDVDYYAQAYAMDDEGNYYYGDMVKFTSVAAILFDANGGTGNMDAMGLAQSQEDNLTANSFTRNGYDFAGWNTEANGTGTSYSNEASFTMSGTTDITLYAQWAFVEYSITYYPDGGTNDASNPTTYNIGSPTITFANAEKTNYDFDGWYSNAEKTTSISQIQTGSYDNLEVWAKWLPTEYSITYHLDGGTNATANPANYNIESPVINLANASKQGFVFVGWYTDSEKTSQISQIDAGSTGNYEIWAKWEETTTNVQSENASKIKFYPNPVKDCLNIEFSKPYKGEVKLSDISGRLIFTKIIDNATFTTLNVSHLTRGVYILNNDQNTFNIKIIK